MSLIDNMKDIADLVKKAGDIELYRKIIESEGEVIELTRDKRRLEDKVTELEKTLALQKEMRFNESFYYQEDDKTPYCPGCWEGTKRAVHVTFIFENSQSTRWDCPICNHVYMIERNKGFIPQGRAGHYGPQGWMGS